MPQRIGEADAQVGQLKGQVEQAQAKLDQANLNLSWTVVTAPQDGWITKRNVEVGNYVTARPADLLDRLAGSLDHRQLQGNPARPTCGRASRSMIEIDAYPHLDLRGHVDSIQLGSGSKFTAFPPENATGNFVKIVQRVPVKIVIDSGLDPNIAAAARHFGRADGDRADERGSDKLRERIRPGNRNTIHGSIAVVVTLAAFMEILDTTIVNVALAAYRRQPVVEQRRSDLGADVLSRRQRHRADDLRLAQRRVSAASAIS